MDKYPQVLWNDWQVQLWTDKHTCYFAYFKRPPICNHTHTIHATKELALADVRAQAGITE